MIRTRWLDVIPLLLILLLAAYTRLGALEDNPGWYTDEGTQLDIALHMRQGVTQYLAINQSTLLFAKFPLFPALVALAANFTGENMTAARVVSGSLGVLSVLLMYVVVRRASRDRWLPLLAAFCLAIYPGAVVYGRLAFSYNLLAPLVLLVLWGSMEYLESQRRGWLLLAALSVGVGLVNDLLMANLLVPLVVVALMRRPRDVLWSVPLALLPFGVYALVNLLTVPDAFLFDLAFTLSRLGGKSLLIQVVLVPFNFLSLFTMDYWIAIGVVGLFLLADERLRRVSLLLLLFTLVMLTRTVEFSPLSYFYTIPLMPLVALGVAGLLRFGAVQVFAVMRDAFKSFAARMDWLPSGTMTGWLRTRLVTLGTTLSFFMLMIAPMMTLANQQIQLVTLGFTMKAQDLLIDPADARAVAQYVARYARPGDVVIASPGLGWALRGVNVADFQMAVAYNRINTAHLPDDIPYDRFAFDPRYTSARYVIVDNLWRNWAMVNMPQVNDMARDVASRWRAVFTSGELTVYQNPALP